MIPLQFKKEIPPHSPKSSKWKWGIFYFNKKDKRIFPPKKDKYAGWTVNFANPYSIATVIILIALLIIIGRYLFG